MPARHQNLPSNVKMDTMKTDVETDALLHFLFEHTPIRGNLTHLNQTFKAALSHQALPPVLRIALGELMAASALLSATLKMDGALILQIQGQGPLQLLVVECNADLSMRATAKWTGEIDETSTFLQLITAGQCAISLIPKQGEPYQGIVPLEGDSIAAILENYMHRSQQIDTRLWLHCDGEQAAGLLLQKLPDQPEQDLDAWHRITLLADTVNDTELQTLDAATLLRRLFHEETLRLFEAKPTQFHCTCTRESVANMLRMLGRAEAESIIAERNDIEVHCDFCNQRYQFDAIDITTLFADEPPMRASGSIH